MQRSLVLWLILTATACVTVRPPAAPAPAASAGRLVILVGLDGWRWDYDRKAPTPNVNALAARGVRAEGLIPAYPTKTFPNMYSIATGLMPAHHGMVANVMRDTVTGKRFDRERREDVEDPVWWGGEPIWNTAERGGLVSATMFWVGSEAPVGGRRAKHWRSFDESVSTAARVDQVLAWLDLPLPERPAFITLYLNDVDTMGHWYGPNSTQVRDAIASTDAELGRLLGGLRNRGLADVANVVLVSDHGMAETAQARTIYADDYISRADGEITDINPTLGVVPAPGRDDAVFEALRRAHPNLKVYRREETPQHWRFQGQPRVAAVTGVVDEGWVIIRRREAGTYWRRSQVGGQHGYDPRSPAMRGLFVAAGPAFRQGLTVPAFSNVEVYNVLAMALGITPAPNDGSAEFTRSILSP